MTTPNHTAIAAICAIQTADLPLPMKMLVVVGLTVSHLIADLLPHMHYYDTEKLPKGILGGIIEVIGGLVVLPAIIWWLTGINPWWLALCVFAASAFDIAVAIYIVADKYHLHFISRLLAWINRLNELAHWWKKYIDDRSITTTGGIIEVAQTIVIFVIFVTIIVHAH